MFLHYIPIKRLSESEGIGIFLWAFSWLHWVEAKKPRVDKRRTYMRPAPMNVYMKRYCAWGAIWWHLLWWKLRSIAAWWPSRYTSENTYRSSHTSHGLPDPWIWQLNIQSLTPLSHLIMSHVLSRPWQWSFGLGIGVSQSCSSWLKPASTFLYYSIDGHFTSNLLMVLHSRIEL